uniref:NADH dehydrogenase subunit 4L n=1 Tax=Pseudanoplocephala crawfordi TaxID=1480107 RepID=A0A0U2NZD1_9CEST|nr:NADH dehydrogenase subunit 4L [Pseudanoplocephala crawfordi]ALJ78643.1 NADH dehydrogenase subunit 4L [Pseudanoplocephala crawfordi]
MITIFLVLFFIVVLSFFLSFSRFLNCLIILENFNVLLLLFCLLLGTFDSHMMFIILIVVSTVEIIVGLVVLTRVWECSSTIELISF